MNRGQVCSDITMQGVMEYLYSRLAKSLEHRHLCDVFDSLIYRADDNGHEICQVLHNWIHNEIEGKVEIGLYMNEVFICNSRDEILALTEKIRKQWPNLLPQCELMLASWDKNVEHK